MAALEGWLSGSIRFSENMLSAIVAAAMQTNLIGRYGMYHGMIEQAEM